MQFKVAKDKIDAYYVYYRLYAQDSGGQRRYQSEPNYTVSVPCRVPGTV